MNRGGVFGQSIVIVRPAWVTDRAGNRSEDWTATTRYPVDRVSVQPNAQAEEHGTTGSTATTGYRVLTEPGTVPAVTAGDRVEWRDQTFLVDGEVAFWPDPRGLDHIEFRIVRTEAV